MALHTPAEDTAYHQKIIQILAYLPDALAQRRVFAYEGRRSEEFVVRIAANEIYLWQQSGVNFRLEIRNRDDQELQELLDIYHNENGYVEAQFAFQMMRRLVRRADEVIDLLLEH